MTELIALEGAQISVTVDPGRGSDILSVTDKRTGINVMFVAPWRDRADSIRDGRSVATATGSMQAWLEQYRGGWQVLCPNAGAPRTKDGSPLGYHGEASTTEWVVGERTASSLRLRTTLFSLPLEIHRTVRVEADAVTVDDRVVNLSGVPIEFDFAHHPALGGQFLDGECEIQSGARSFVNDFEAGLDGVTPGSSHSWPLVTCEDGTILDLTVVPGPLESRSVFGYLTDFDSHWASVTNPQLGMTVRLDWDGALLPHAWFWQELNDGVGWPWFRRARVIAVEPSSTQTSGPERRSAIKLDPRGEMSTSITLSIESGQVL